MANELELKRDANDTSAHVIRCPKCGSEQVVRSDSPFKRSFSLGWALLGGIPLSVLHAGGQKQRFRCNSCQEFFFRHTRGSKVALCLFVLFALLSVLGLFLWLSKP